MGRSLSRVVACAHALPLLLFSVSCGSGTEPPAPRATRLVLLGAPSTTAETMVPLADQPIVQTADAGGIAVATATTVTAEVVSGGGAVMAAGSATTDASGRAAFSRMTLGAVGGGHGGVLKLRFTSPGLEPVTADVELRCAVLPLAIGQTVNGALRVGDCAFASGNFTNLYEITTSQSATAVRLTAEAAFTSSLLVQGPNETNYFWGHTNRSTLDRYSFKALLSPGRNRVSVSAGAAGSTGSYSLSAAAATEDLTCSDALMAVATTPITTSQQLGAGDCSSDSFLEDWVIVGLPANASITASMTTSAFQPRVRLLDAITEEVVADGIANGSASLVFANGSTTKGYFLLLSSQAIGSSGAYTLKVNITYPSGGAVADAAPVLSPPMLDAIARRAGSSGRRIAIEHVPMAAR